MEKKFKHHIKYIDMGGGLLQKHIKGFIFARYDTCPTFDQYADAITNSYN